MSWDAPAFPLALRHDPIEGELSGRSGDRGRETVFASPRIVRGTTSGGHLASADFDLLRGTLDLLVLRALSAGPQHGFGVTQWISQVTRDELTVEDGAMYTSLHRLEKRGFVKGEWGITENNRRARYYTLTAAGRRELAADTVKWTAYAVAVIRVLKNRREAIDLLEGAV